jgi:hypothetical protein
MNKLAREKSPGEMTGQELRAALYAATGLREPRDPAQQPAFTVAQALIIAMRGFADRDLVEKCLIDTILGNATAEGAAVYQPLVEAALGRRLPPDEPRRYPLASLLEERARRQSKETIFD